MRDFSKELSYKTSRSSGAGGQNVNKVETSVTVMWKIAQSALFQEDEKNLITAKLSNRVNQEGVLQLTVSEARTQIQNKKAATEKILELVNKSLLQPKKRKPTKPSKGQIEKRLQAKKQRSEKKDNRKFRF
ncbi:aminoacyl-tRNA hydrolase [Chryseobacterium sp. 6424]|uniref:alternative ribosome rescue aminoacyl-tRNA hydrolase ArfB n=1 Tax=Chryseobacterium sp. 6424 TaxID=2039166 RepID=UPI000EFC318E|nr:alternative ribosome rescue aminoacyl-tRNA hydrolase ArfB [Chryseobacterium sp. 6424]AYO56891.1 aminoacyl-tRNA hydrolase [Chryseobacterium sp. 6424]